MEYISEPPEYNLPETELSPYCRGRYNPETGKFEDVSTIDTIKCCLSSCGDHIKFCYDTCDRAYNSDYQNRRHCYKKCAELVNDCESNCMEVPSRGLSVISYCSKKCGTYPVFNLECLKSQKQAIIDCCKEQSPNQSCDELYGYLSGGVQFPLAKLVRRVGNVNADRPQERKNAYAIYFLLFLVAICLAIIIVNIYRN